MIRISNVSKNIKYLRESNRITLKEVAEGAGISVGFLHDIENGRTMPSIKTLLRLAEFYDETDLNFFFYDQKEEGMAEDIVATVRKPMTFMEKIQEIIDKFGQDPERMHHELDRLMEDMLIAQGYDQEISLIRIQPMYYA
jgi:transcriptional regulator with XRE-family HTH domain